MSIRRWINVFEASLFGHPVRARKLLPGRDRCRPMVESLEDRLAPASITWIGGAYIDTVSTSGSPTDWNNPYNWVGNTVPGAGDTAVFTNNVNFSLINGNPPPATVSYTSPFNDSPVINSAVAIAGISVDSSAAFSLTVNASSSLTLSGASEWDAGTINSVGTLTNNGTLTIGGTGSLYLSGTLNNAGTITQVSATSYNTLYFNSGAVLNNSGLYDIQENGTALQTNGGSGWAFNNSGTLQKSGPATVGTATLGSVLFNNAAIGSVNVTSGTLSLTGGGTDLGGTFTASTGDTLDLTGGSNFTLTGMYTGSGGGTVTLASGGLTIGVAGATFDFPQGLFQWTGGAIDATAGTLTNAATGFLTLSSTGNMYLGGTLDNAGTITQVAPSSFNTLYFNSGAILNNSGLYDIQENGTALQTNGGSGWAFNNSGTFQKSGPVAVGTATLGSVPFNNAALGVVNVTSGVLSLSGGGTDLGGTFTASSGDTLDLTGGSGATLTGTYTGSGDGTVSLASGALVIGAAGTTFNFPQNYFQWTGGTINATASALTNAATGFLTLSATGNLYLSGTLVNVGTITQIAPSSFNTLYFNAGAILNNSGLYDIQENGTALQTNGGSGWAFNNSGTFQKSAGGGTASLGSVPFNNAATADVNVTSGVLSLSGGGTDLGGTFAVSSGNTLDLTAGSSPTLTGTYTGSGGGTVSLASGALVIGALGATFNFPQSFFQWTGGGIDGSLGALTNAATYFITIGGVGSVSLSGTLDNAGTITQVAPSSFNTLYFNAGAILNNSGLYDIQENGTALQTNGGSGWAFNNSGTFQKSAGGGTASLGSVPFNNAATADVNVTSGVLSLSGGGTDLGGTFTVSSGNTLDLTAGSGPTLTGTYTGSGGGTVSLASGALVIGALGATFNFPQSFFQWTGGGIDGSLGALTNAATGFLTLSATGNMYLAGTLDNAGAITQVAASSYNTLYFNSGAILNNSGLYDIQENGTALQTNGGSGWAFNNSGTFQKSGPAAAGAAGVGSLPFNNAAVGVVNVTTGILSITGGGTDLGGTFTVSGGAYLNLPGGGASPTLTGTYVGSGAGTLFLGAGTLTIGAAGATFDFPQNFFQWTGGAIDASAGMLTNAATGFLTLSATGNMYLAGTLDNAGAITQVAASSYNTLYFNSGAILNNSGLYDIQENGTALQTNGGSGWAFNNSGILQKSGPATVGTATVSVPFNNMGGAINATSGTLALAGGGTTTGATYNVASGAQVNYAGGTHIFSGSYTGSGAGAVVLTNGTISVPSSAAFDLSGGGFDINGGSLSVAGTVTNAGIIGVLSSATITGSWNNQGSLLLYQNTNLGSAGAVIDNTGVIGLQPGVTLAVTGTSLTNETGALISGGGTLNTAGVTFTNSGIVDLILPSVFDVELHAASIQVTYVFSGSMNASTVTNTANYSILASGGDGIFGNSNDVDRSTLISGITYDSTTGVATISFSQNLPTDLYRLSINGDAVQDTAGNSLYPSATILVNRGLGLFGPAPAVASVVVNGGTPAYSDGNSLAVSLAGQNSVVEQILVTFNEAVTLDPGAFTITNNAAGVTVNNGPAPNTLAVTANFAVVPGSGNTQYLVTFSGPGTTTIQGGAGAAIKDGLYILNTVGSHVHANGLTAADNNTGFWALYGSAVNSDNVLSGTLGDGNSEVFVDNFDYSAFKSTFGSESDIPAGPPAPYNVALDGDLNGFIDNFDYSEFKSNFGADWSF